MLAPLLRDEESFLLSEPVSVRPNFWYHQGSGTCLLDPVHGVDNGDDDGADRLQEIEKSLHVNCLQRGDFSRAKSSIVVAVDGTPASRRALSEAIRITSAAHHRHLFVLHVWQPADPLAAWGIPVPYTQNAGAAVLLTAWQYRRASR